MLTVNIILLIAIFILLLGARLAVLVECVRLPSVWGNQDDGERCEQIQSHAEGLACNTRCCACINHALLQWLVGRVVPVEVYFCFFIKFIQCIPHITQGYIYHGCISSPLLYLWIHVQSACLFSTYTIGISFKWLMNRNLSVLLVFLISYIKKIIIHNHRLQKPA